LLANRHVRVSQGSYADKPGLLGLLDYALRRALDFSVAAQTDSFTSNHEIEIAYLA